MDKRLPGMKLRLPAMIGAAGRLFIGCAHVFGGLVGAIYWAAHESLPNLILSMIIPLYGVMSVMLDVLL
jgi:hypothetical protein